MKRKIILILGGGIMQMPSLRCAREKGWYVILADGNDQAPGRDYAHSFEHVDLKDKEGMLTAAENWKHREGLDGVFTAGTDFSATVAWVSEHLGLPGITYETALRASDKELMRQCFSSHGVPSPRFTVYLEGDTRPPEVTGFRYPLVVKPVDNMGARGIRRVDTPAEFAEALPEAVAHSLSKRVIVEQYIDGPEFSIDAIVYKGEITVCGIADRHIFFPPYFVEMGHTMPTSQPPEVVNQIVDVFCRGVEAIGISDGAAKGDIKLSSSGPVVGEIAARLSGGFMSGWTYPYHSGVVVTEAALNIAVGNEPGTLKPRFSQVSAERAIISIPGRIRESRGMEEAKGFLGVKELFTGVEPGDMISFPTNNVEKWGNVISCLDTHEEAVEAAETGGGLISVLLEQGGLETLRFLLRKDFPWAPDAYHLEVKENRRAIAAMSLTAGDELSDEGPEFFETIAALPRMKAEHGKDWNHIPFMVGLEKVSSITGIRFSANPSGDRSPPWLSSLFWNAYLRGGYQGGVWLIETLRTLAREEGNVIGFIEEWI